MVTAEAETSPTAFIAYPSLAKADYSAPGGTDITFSALGLAAINPNDEVIFENRFIGARGFGQQINSSGATLVTLTGDRGIKELVILNPSKILGVVFTPR